MSVTKVTSHEVINFLKMGNDEIVPLYGHVIDHLASRSDDDSVWITTVFSLVTEIKKRQIVPEEAAQDMSNRAFKVIVREKEEHEIKDPDLIDFLQLQGFPILTLRELSYRVKTSPVNDAVAFLYRLKDEWGDLKQEGLDLYGKLLFWGSNNSHADCQEAHALGYILLCVLYRKEVISEKRFRQERDKLGDKPDVPSQEATDPFELCIQRLSAHTGDADEVLGVAKEAFALTDSQKEPLKVFRAFLMTVVLHHFKPQQLGISDPIWSWVFIDEDD